MFISKFLFVAFSFGLINGVYAQDTATLLVKIFNENQVPLAGEQILFEAETGIFKTANVSNREGMMKVKLLGGNTYKIKVKTIGEAEEYNTIAIPALPKGQKYGENELTITIYEAKTFTLNNVYFDSGKSTLQATSYKELDELLAYLKLKPSIKIEIAGHTDSEGNDDANMLLSENRAITVKNYLIKNGIASTRIQTKAYGETQPIATNETEEGRSKNRRITINILP
jgi:OOP family OmpA-OmpF porin